MNALQHKVMPPDAFLATDRMEYYETKYRQQQLQWAAKQAAVLNMQLDPVAEVAG